MRWRSFFLGWDRMSWCGWSAWCFLNTRCWRGTARRMATRPGSLMLTLSSRRRGAEKGNFTPRPRAAAVARPLPQAVRVALPSKSRACTLCWSCPAVSGSFWWGVPCMGGSTSKKQQVAAQNINDADESDDVVSKLTEVRAPYFFLLGHCHRQDEFDLRFRATSTHHRPSSTNFAKRLRRMIAMAAGQSMPRS